MYRVFAILLLTASPALAQDGLNFDIAKLCEWQSKNNAMDLAECTKMESEAQKAQAELEGKADAKRKEECFTEAKNYSGDSGFASHTVYTQCLKNGPGNL